MRKWLLIFALCWGCTGIMASQGNQDAHPNPQPTKQEQPAPVPPNGKQPQPQAGDEHGKSDGVSPGGNAPFKWPQWMHDSDWWLVIVAGLTGSFIGWQGWETRKAASAARDQAQLMHESGRARLTIARIPPPEPQNPIELYREPTLPQIEIVNQGAAYAYDVSGGSVYFLTNLWLEIEPTLHPLPIPTVLKSGDSFQVRWPSPIILPFDENGTGKEDPIRNGFLSLHVYVKVSYRDIYGPMNDAALHLCWKVDIEETETGVEEQPLDTADYSDWEIVPALPSAPRKPN